jgi:hypothetical protein
MPNAPYEERTKEEREEKTEKIWRKAAEKDALSTQSS